MEASKPSGMADSARAYAARAWSVIPMQPRGKRPLVSWREFQQRIAGEDEIAHWFSRWPDANVGIVTGQISGIVVVDVDIRHGGPASLAEAVLRHGALDATVEVATGGGGRHLYYTHPGVATANRVAMLPGIDLRGDGGCVVASPSVHPSGRCYAWVAGRSPEEVALAPLPRHFGGGGAGLRPHRHPIGRWRHLVREDIVEGARNNTIASLCGHLLWRGVEGDVVAELMRAWNRSHCRPPLSDAEVLRVVDSVERMHERDSGAAA